MGLMLSLISAKVFENYALTKIMLTALPRIINDSS